MSARARTISRWPTTISPSRSAPNFGYAYNNRGTIHLRRGALQSALDDFNLSIKYTPTFLLGWTNRARMRTLNEGFRRRDCRLCGSREDRPGRAADRRQPLHHLRHDGQVRPGLRRLQRPDPEAAQEYQFAINNRAEVNVMKGDLDAALKDYNTVIQLNPNSVRAHSGRGQIYERRKDLAQARADYRAAAYSLTRFDELDVARARAIAQERLGRTDAAGAGRVHRAPRGAGDRQRRLQERPRPAQSAARRETDRKRAARCRLPDRDLRQRPHPRQVLRGAADVCRRKRRMRIGRWSITPATVSRSAA